MNKRSLIKRIRDIAKEEGFELTFARQGRNHEIWIVRNQRLVIPRHRQINEHTAQSIIAAVEEVTRDEQ